MLVPVRTRSAVFLLILAASALALFKVPDLDIPLLGIGNHRYFLFHSAILPVVAWFALRRWKLIGVAIAAGFALGVGVHLLTDVVQTKAVVFPWAKTLVAGTSVDDRLWEGGNAVVCWAITWRGWMRRGTST
jgi:membrane-bound metal-dependent hydrolase YbcI (DUF457 family)